MEAKGTRLVERGGIYYIVWTGNSRGRSTRTGDRKVAERALAAYIQEDGKDDPGIGGLTVAQAIEDYLLEHARGTASAEQAEIAADYFLAHFPVERRIADTGEADFAAYMKSRRTGALVLKRANPKPAGDGTLRRELGFIGAAFSHAAKKKRIHRNDLPHIPFPPAPPPRDRWLSADEEATLCKACRVETTPVDGEPARLTRIWRFLVLALDTAARKEAIETLTWFQVDFAAGTINLNPKGRAQTKKRRSVISMSARLRAMLERAFREKTTGFVLDHPGSIRSSFERLVLRSKLDDVTPHILRHTWATRAARAGVSMREIADFMGDDIRTVEKNYYHHHPDYLKAAANWRDREVGVTDQKEKGNG